MSQHSYQQHQQQYDVNQLTGDMGNLGFAPPMRPSLDTRSVSGSSTSRKKRPVYVVDEALNTPPAPSMPQTPSIGGFPFNDSNQGSPFTPVQHNFNSALSSINGTPAAAKSSGDLRHLASTTSLPATGQFYQNPQQFQSQLFDQSAMGLQQLLHITLGHQPQQLQQKSTISHIPETGSNQQYSPEDSLQIPTLRHEASQEWAKVEEFRTFENVHPPMVGVKNPKFVDQGVTPPNFMRLSMYSIPASNSLLKASRLPLGLMVRPFAPVEEGNEVPVVDLSNVGGPPRCNRCRAYINAQWQFTVSYKMICNMCQFASDCPPGYGAALDPSGRRIDHYQRPELHKGVVDFIVPKEYNAVEGQENSPLNYIFLIDLSESSLAQGVNKCVGDCIRQTIYNGGECNLPLGAKICLIGFDKKLYFYNLSPSLQVPSISTVSDLEDPFIPFYEGLFVDPSESRAIIEDTLTMIESRDHFKVAEPCFGTALKLSLLALESFGGGKVTSILTSLPSSGAGVLKYKDPHNRNVIEREKSMLTADSPYYNELAKDFATLNIGLDLFIISPTSVDLANTGLISFKTGGNIKLYQNFNLDRDERKLVFEFKSSVANDTGYQGQLKIRCSSGLQVQNYYGNFYKKNDSPSAEPAIAVLNNEQTLMCDFVLDGQLNPKLDAHFQAAVLYTDTAGVRKVRVVNMVCAVTERVGDVFVSAEQDTIINLWIRQQLLRLPTATLQTLRNFSNLELVNCFTQYRALVAGSTAHSQQLVIPETLKALTMYSLAFQKSRIVKSLVLNGDSKILSWHFLNSSTFEKIAFNLYPLIIAIHDLEDDECTYNDKQVFQMPRQTRLCGQSIQIGGCYFAFNGHKMVLWIHPQANPLLLNDLFGEHVNSLQDINPIMDEVPLLSTHISQQLNNLVKFVSKTYLNLEFAPILIARVGIDGTEQEFLEMLVEDQTPDKIYSYSEYLTHIHKCIKDKVANEKPKNVATKSGGPTDLGSLTQRWMH